MRSTSLCLLFLLGVALWTQTAAAQPKEAPPAGVDEERAADDRKLLRRLGIEPDGPALLDYFRKRTFPEANPEKVKSLIAQMGDEDFRVREKAFVELQALGTNALFTLRQAETATSDAEVRRRVYELRRAIEEKANAEVQSAAARLVASTRPKGATEVLLAYVPFAATPDVVEELSKALLSVGVEKGVADPALTQALADKVALKRGLAAEALLRGKVQESAAAAKQLLKDTDPATRLRVALALAALRDRDAIAGLIEVLAHLPPEQLWQAEDILVRLAGDKTPAVSLGTTDATRKQAHDAWEEWWSKHKDTIKITKLDEETPYLGYTLMVYHSMTKRVNNVFMPGVSKVTEVDQHKKVRWEFALPAGYPVDAQVIGDNRVLITEYQGRQISIRDFKGTVIWNKAVNVNPTSAQQLANGNIFVVAQNRLCELDKNGVEKWVHDRPQHDVVRARKLANGDVVYCTQQGQLIRMDAKANREISNVNVGQLNSVFGAIDILPNGNMLLPIYTQQRVVELSPQGKEVWQVPFRMPSSAVRLPNGNTLVASLSGFVGQRVVEFNRQGTEVWAFPLEGQVFVARRR